MGLRTVCIHALLGTLLLVGAGQPADAASRADLDQWTRATLVPYLTEQISRHPRFRGERIAIVALEGTTVAPRIDGLTAKLRATLIDALMLQQGVHLSWDSANAVSADAACSGESAPGYYLGIEVQEGAAGSATVSVRALDRLERTFVPGFGMNWQGRLSRTQSSALKSRLPDESLRGQRALPFADSQADLVAAYLAGRLSCHLRRRGLDSTFSAPAPSPQNDGYASRIEALVSNYLARGRRTAAEDAVELFISARLHPIDGDLTQLWVTATTGSDGESLPAIATDVYLRTSPSPQPVGSLLAAARLVRSTVADRCSEPRVWRSESTLRPVISGWPADSCVALEVRSQRSAYLFALAHPGNGRLQLVYPSGCRSSASLEAVSGLRRFALTSLHNGSASASPTFYVVAVATKDAAKAFARHMQTLNAQCGAGELREADLDQWLADLEQLLQRHGSDADWRVLRTNFGGPQEQT